MVFKKGYIMTKQHKEKIGKTNSNLIRNKIEQGNFVSPMKDKHHSEEVKNRLRNIYLGKIKIQINKEKLNDLYTFKKMTALQCAKFFKCSEGCIVSRLKQLGIKQRNKSEAKMGNLNPTFGIKNNPGSIAMHSKESKEKAIATLKRRYASGELQGNMKGKKQSLETINKSSAAHILYYKTHPESIEKLKERRKTMVLPKKDTSIEIKIQNYLKQLDYEFFTHQYINKIEHGYQCDILIPALNLVIECDGNYWHNYPIGREIDHIRTSELLEKGFKVLRLWECEINKMTINEFQNKLNNTGGKL